MGHKWDALIGKNFKTAKFKTLVELVSSKIAVLEKQHRLRGMQAQSDVISHLKLAHQESALLRVELVITEQNMLDVYAMIESYCNLLEERVVLIENNKECPDDLKEAISSLIYAASKCGELPELQKISNMFLKRFGKEFANNAVELCNNCGVCPKIVKKLSTSRPSLENKLDFLKEIALANGIDLHLEGEAATKEMKKEAKKKQHVVEDSSKNNEPNQERRVLEDQVLGRKKYRDFKDAAQTAYKLAAHAAEAARAAVEFSQDKYHDHRRKSAHKRNVHPLEDHSKSELPAQGDKRHPKYCPETREIHMKATSSRPGEKIEGENTTSHLKESQEETRMTQHNHHK
ncbi:hypothetical protein UlMin_014398 [Ulmus minor]